MSNPFIPLMPADIAIVHGRASEEIIQNLKKQNIKTIIPTIKCQGVDESISFHPDIVIHPVDHHTPVIEPSVFEYYDKILSRLGIKSIKGHSTLQRTYPLDIAYNVGRVDNFIFHKKDNTDSVIVEFIQRYKLKFNHIKQGYSKCSMALLDNNSVITSDKNIYKKLKELYIEALLINPGLIHLQGHMTGFIGGCTGNYDLNTIMISGSLDKHPDKERIENFIKKRGLEIVYLSKENISDIGTIICLNSK